eukprot:TRINITY_DN29886_c0_g1_i1.p2 TRINITY_DN29886_c0_g1~~TRINITY_DN29886_c0_g1_i1.p2  ORF type:complete len:222 (-),score=38.94 TRINITY_DN29886_c0_g1_i1:67-732(-)
MGLPDNFMLYLKDNKEVLEEIRAWQERYGDLFQGQLEELPLAATDAYNAFIALVDRHLEAFLASQQATADDFAEALIEMRKSSNPHWNAFDLVLQKVDFPGFASMLRRNVCLCCGGQFRAIPTAAPPVGVPCSRPAPVPAGDAGPEPEPPLPEGWTAHVDPETGNTFYMNAADGSTTWERPAEAPLPDGWTAHLDAASGRHFYASSVDGSTTWDRPVAPPC